MQIPRAHSIPLPHLLFLALLCLSAGLHAEDAADDAELDDVQREEVVEVRNARLPELPFVAGEKLYYKIGWGIFNVASASLEIDGPVDFDGQKAWKIEMFVRTNGFADAILKVRDHNIAWVNEEFTHPLRYIKQQNEGDVHHDVVVDFDWDKMEAHYTDRGKTRDPVKLVDGTWDMLSITYAVRALNLEGLDSIRVPSTDGKKLAMTDVKILPSDRVKTPMGRFDVVLLQPDTKNLGGIFRKSRNAGINIWFTDDERHLPVQVSSKVIVGSFTAEMTKMEGPGAEDYKHGSPKKKKKASKDGQPDDTGKAE